jgi:predicted RNA binding protein YcfA (HicA-like mRNA interferase family)
MSKKVREVIIALERAGWSEVRQRGSHRVFKHPERRNIITVSGKRGEDMKPGVLASIRRKSGIEDLR